MASGSKTLEELFAVIESRKNADPAVSYTAKLIRDGRLKIAKKVGEEGVEAALAGLKGERSEIIGESADLLYHLLVLWAERGVRPRDVFKELSARVGVSGIEEKKSRSKKKK